MSIHTIIRSLTGESEAQKQFDEFRRQVENPNQSWPVVGQWHLGIHPHLIVGTGVDSVVCNTDAVPGKVFKVYRVGNRCHAFPQLDFYKTLTAKAGEVVGEANSRLRMRVNPIDELVYWSEKYCWVGVSDFIRGYNLGVLLGQNLGGVEEVCRIRELLGSLSESRETLSKEFSRVSEFLNRRLDVSGINIVPINVAAEFRDDISPDNLTFVVTDLAGSISALSSR